MPTFSARYSPWRLLLLLLLSVLFVVLFVWMVLDDSSSPLHKTMGVIGGLLFVGVAVLTWLRLFDRREQLRVSPEGIYYRQWSEATIPWSAISDVTVWKYRRQRSIVLRLADPQRFRSTTLLGRMSRANRRLTGGDIAISLTPMDRGFDDALTVIEDYRATSAR